MSTGTEADSLQRGAVMRDESSRPPVLTLHHGDSTREFAEHPTEAARKALIVAAEVEDGVWPALLLRAAAALPCRAPLARTALPSTQPWPA
jgi:hypothetical protein